MHPAIESLHDRSKSQFGGPHKGHPLNGHNDVTVIHGIRQGPRELGNEKVEKQHDNNKDILDVDHE